LFEFVFVNLCYFFGHLLVTHSTKMERMVFERRAPLTYPTLQHVGDTSFPVHTPIITNSETSNNIGETIFFGFFGGEPAEKFAGEARKIRRSLISSAVGGSPPAGRSYAAETLLTPPILAGRLFPRPKHVEYPIFSITRDARMGRRSRRFLRAAKRNSDPCDEGAREG
jgi:hypothetical protein